MHKYHEISELLGWNKPKIVIKKKKKLNVLKPGEEKILSKRKANIQLSAVHRNGNHVSYSDLGNGKVKLTCLAGRSTITRKSKNDFLNTMRIGDEVIVESVRRANNVRYSMYIRGMKPSRSLVGNNQYKVKRIG